MSWLAPAALSLAALMAAFAAMWLISLRLRDVGVVDVAWGPGFVLVTAIWAAMAGVGTPSALLVAACVTAWGARLGVHLFLRHRRSAQEDARYAAMRSADPAGFPRRSLATVFLLQAVILWGLALPIHFAFAVQGAETERPVSWLHALGLALFLAGFMLEALADWQLARFRSDPANRGRLLTAGLFAWSRHPNYFGESMLWFGIAAMSHAGTGQIWVYAGPAALTFLLLKVSGVTLLDAHLASTRPEFAAYARRTSAFIPWPPRN